MLRTVIESGRFELDELAKARGVRAVVVLAEAWRLLPGEEDLTVMRVEVVGSDDGAAVRHVFDLLDRYDPVTKTSSRARTIGYTCTALVRWLASGRWSGAGVSPPEVLAAEPGRLDFALSELAQRGVHVAHRVEPRP